MVVPSVIGLCQEESFGKLPLFFTFSPLRWTYFFFKRERERENTFFRFVCFNEKSCIKINFLYFLKFDSIKKIIINKKLSLVNIFPFFTFPPLQLTSLVLLRDREKRKNTFFRLFVSMKNLM